MKFDLRVAFAVTALTLASCQGLDSGMGGMGGGMMGPPVQQPGPIGSGNLGGANQASGPIIGSNGQAELMQPGATLAPNQTQFPVSQGPSGVKCPTVTQFGCNFSFNMPTPAPLPSGAKPTPKPTATPTPTPSPSPSASSDDDSEADATATPAGMITLELEPLPKDVPAMTNPDPRALRITPLSSIRLQSDADFSLNGQALVSYVMPRQQILGRSFAIQLYNEAAVRGKRVDTYLGTYTQASIGDTTVQFTFPTPTVTVRRGQIWLLALYGMQFPPGTTPTPSPSPSPSSSSSASPSPSPKPS